jgi:hypothetical protein
MELLIFGHYGPPLLAFPSAGGRFFDWENQGMVEAAGPWLEGGKVRLYCVDGVDHESWLNFGADMAARAGRHREYEACIVHELAPFIQQECALSEGGVAVTGCMLRPGGLGRAGLRPCPSVGYWWAGLRPCPSVARAGLRPCPSVGWGRSLIPPCSGRSPTVPVCAGSVGDRPELLNAGSVGDRPELLRPCPPAGSVGDRPELLRPCPPAGSVGDRPELLSAGSVGDRPELLTYRDPPPLARRRQD